jgi:Protein of unknown function (DUF1769)
MFSLESREIDLLLNVTHLVILLPGTSGGGDSCTFDPSEIRTPFIEKRGSRQPVAVIAIDLNHWFIFRLARRFDLFITGMTPEPKSTKLNVSSLSLAQGMWENAPSERLSSPPPQRLSLISISSSLYDSWSQLEMEDSIEVEHVDSEARNSAEDQIQMNEVETRLLELFQQQNVESSSNEHDQSFLKIGSSKVATAPLHQPHEFPCADSHRVVPSPPTLWPQAPIMLRPTPNTQMTIRGIRYANSTTYQHFPGICAGCILPINSGYELPGQSLVIDFESPLFVGSFLMRVKGARSIGSSTSSTENQNDPEAASEPRTNKATANKDVRKGYFDGKKRQFQVVVKGRFKEENIPMSDCVTGQAFDRPAGKLPARFLVNTFVKFISTLAPQLEVELDGNRPRFLSPLVATAHTVISKDSPLMNTTRNRSGSFASTVLQNGSAGSNDSKAIAIPHAGANMEEDVEEPAPNDSTSVMTAVPIAIKGGLGENQRTVVQRRALRKKAFNRLAANKSGEPIFDVNKEYTFEFYQHLLLLTEPDDFKIDMGHNIQISLARSLNGQPIKILAARRSRLSCDSCSGLDQVLWSFDLWHEALYPFAAAFSENETRVCQP